MRSAPSQTTAAGRWRRVRRCVGHVGRFPANRDSAYSPLVCLSLLLAIGLIIEINQNFGSIPGLVFLYQN
jgi:hypothetical protein